MTRIKKAIRIFVCTLREIFDEAAYDSLPAANSDGFVFRSLRSVLARARNQSATEPRCC